MPFSRLQALSPLDGRYADQVADLAAIFSEQGLMRHRVAVEVEYLIAFMGWTYHPAEREPAVARALRNLYLNFGEAEADAIKAVEGITRHDMKSVEYWIKERVKAIPAMAESVELVHLGLTSDDVNNLAYALMHREALHRIFCAELAEVLEALASFAKGYASVPMLARTHGQPASPTTLGKELGVFASRLAREAEQLAGFRFPGKLTGATGTLAALEFAYPERSWIPLTRGFVEELGLEPAPVTTQVEPADGLAAFYDHLRRLNHVLLDAACDMWRYVSDGYFRQRLVEGEVGSSAMPHKVNPIDFENAEGNLGMANALLTHLGDKLTVSRLQRDLSGSTVLRNSGVALAHTLLGWRSFRRGLKRVMANPERMAQELAAHPEVVGEAIQTLLRARGRSVPYEKVQELTQGKTVTLAELRAAARELAGDLGERWEALDPMTYTGTAQRLAEEAAQRAAAAAQTMRGLEGAASSSLWLRLASRT